MEKGDLDNGMPPRILFVFNGLLGTIPENRERRVDLLRRAGRFKAVAESYEINLMVRAKMHDLTWRRNWRCDVVLFDHEKVAAAMERRFDRLNLAVANVYASDGPRDLHDRLPYMPEVLYVVHGNEEWQYAFGHKGLLGMGGL